MPYGSWVNDLPARVFLAVHTDMDGTELHAMLSALR
jgi:hypothetical protein